MSLKRDPKPVGLRQIMQISSVFDSLESKNNVGWTAMHIALQAQDDKRIHELIDSGADVNELNADGETQLEFAIECSRSSVSLLIGAGADVNALNKHGESLLYIALENCDDELYQALIDAGAYVDHALKGGDTELFNAVYQKNRYARRALITAGAHINFAGKYGNTALHKATMECDNITCLELIALGADINASNTQGDTAFSLMTEQCKKRLKVKRWSSRSVICDRLQRAHIFNMPRLQAAVEFGDVDILQAAIAEDSDFWTFSDRLSALINYQKAGRLKIIISVLTLALNHTNAKMISIRMRRAMEISMQSDQSEQSAPVRKRTVI